MLQCVLILKMTLEKRSEDRHLYFEQFDQKLDKILYDLSKGLTHREIADSIGFKEGTVDKLLGRARNEQHKNTMELITDFCNRSL